MDRLEKAKPREIIDDFARAIEDRKTAGPKPAMAVIDFRHERSSGIERPIFYVPIELLRYRKDNGRISSDVLSYEKDHGILDERSADTQRTIRAFLKEKDPDRTDELKRSISHEGQRDPAIVTCDGFLINGNRRKMVMELLIEEAKHRGDPKLTNMKVVILPGKNDEGGPPTLLEIEQIENRYQLQSEGKAEYSNFDRALSMRRKIDLGMSLEEQLKDDPAYGGLEKKEFKKAVRKLEEEYLNPLECIDHYLEHLGRPGLYTTIAKSIGDREGRWQAFLDYNDSIYQRLRDDRKRTLMGVREDEAGRIEDVAFKIIRKRELPGLPKVHQVMRDLPKWLGNPDAKKELLAIGKEVPFELPKEECYDKEGKEYSEREKDRIWGRKHGNPILRQLNRAKDCYDRGKERETPIDLLEAALKKLNHENMLPESISIDDIPKAMRLAKEIKERADALESDLYHCHKEYKQFRDKHKK
jgi:hypothetical protein